MWVFAAGMGEGSGDAPSGGEVRTISLDGCVASTAESSSSGGHSSSPVMSDGGSALDANRSALRGTNCTGPVGATGRAGGSVGGGGEAVVGVAGAAANKRLLRLFVAELSSPGGRVGLAQALVDG